MTKTQFDFGKGYKYVPNRGIYRNEKLVIDEETLIAITYFQDFVKGVRKGSGLWEDD